MKDKSLTKLLTVVCVVFLMASCTKHRGQADSMDDSQALTSNGLGAHNAYYNQQTGESYTTNAPHNQVYLFNFDNSSIDEKYLPSIDAQAQYIKSHPNARILLAGHTDERGSREYNIALGERRANAVAELIKLKGVKSSQLRVVSYGKERLVNFDHSEDAHRQNRRVELIYEATK